MTTLGSHVLRLLPLVGLAAVIALSPACGPHSDPAESKQDTAAPRLAKVDGQTAVVLDPASLKLGGITTVKIRPQELSGSMQPTGEIEPTDAGTVQITSRLAGKITEALVSVGDRVRAGQVIAKVDSTDLATAEATYETALSHAALAKHQLEQQRRLAGFGSLSEQPVEDARKASTASDAAVASDEAQIRVDRLALRSTEQLVQMGEITRKPLEDAQNAYAQAQASASQAATTLHSTKSNYDRAVILFNGGVFSRQQLEDAETAYNSAQSSDGQAKTAERLAREELTRQENIFNKNLNGASSLQGAHSKLQQDEHAYQNDLVAQQLAHKQYQRALTVRKSGIPISQALQAAEDTYDEAEVAVQGAATTLKLYGVRAGEATGEFRNGRVVIPIVSPIDGIVAARSMVAGQNVDTSTVLARVVNLDRVYIDAQIYEKDIQEAAIGDPVKVTVVSFPDRTFTGKVQFVAHEVNPDTRTILVRTVLDNPRWILRPGMFASLVIAGRGAVHMLSVPSDAVMQEGDRQAVYVEVHPGEFVKRTVRVAQPLGGRTPVVSGLASGDEVVVAGNELLEKAESQLESDSQ